MDSIGLRVVETWLRQDPRGEVCVRVVWAGARRQQWRPREASWRLGQVSVNLIPADEPLHSQSCPSQSFSEDLNQEIQHLKTRFGYCMHHWLSLNGKYLLKEAWCLSSSLPKRSTRGSPLYGLGEKQGLIYALKAPPGNDINPVGVPASRRLH